MPEAPLKLYWKVRHPKLGPSIRQLYVGRLRVHVGWVSFASTLPKGSKNRYQGTVVLPGFKNDTVFVEQEADAQAWVENAVQQWFRVALKPLDKEPKPDA